jgi:D(-)-tartrate dehydratase
MRIVDIRECSAPVKSDMRNSSFDFSEMTTSVVAVITDVVREHRPVVGFAFNSTGRYACGAAMRARFIPRILKPIRYCCSTRTRRISIRRKFSPS